MKSLVRGQKAPLASLGIEAATPALSVEIAIDLAPASEIDVCCFGLDEHGKLSDEAYFVFYNQPKSPCGAIETLAPGGDARQKFAVDFSKLPAKIKRLVFTATTESGTMSQLSRGVVRLIHSGGIAAEFQLQGSDFASEKALMLAELYWNGGWRIAATGQGFAAGLPGLLRHFGGEVAEDPKPAHPAPAPAPAPAPVPIPVPIPVAPPPLSLKKLTLDKPGERKSISLEKPGSGGLIHINMNWDKLGKRSMFGSKSEADLDLGCLYLLRDGNKGCIQALGGNFGSKDRAPHIYLDKDDRSGASSDGENLYISRPDLIERVLVFAFIYEGAANFGTVNGRLTLRETDGSETLIRLNSPRPGATFCAICLITRTSTGIDVIKEEKYFKGHRDADQHFGFGFQWAKGSK